MKIGRLLIIITLIVLTFFVYRNSFKEFFIQDEWQAMGLFLYYKKIGSLSTLFLPSKGIFAHFNPINRIFFWFEFLLFNFRYDLRIFVSLMTHALNAVLLYLFIYKWVKKWKLAFVASLLFIVNSIPQQAITWPDGGNGLLQATTLFLLSLHWLYKYANSNKLRFLFFAVTAFFFSLFLKEDSVFLFLGIPSFYLIIKHGNLKKSHSVFAAMLIIFVAYVCIRLFFVFMNWYSFEDVIDMSTPSIFVYPIRAILTPMRMLVQSFVPELTILAGARLLAFFAYPQFIVGGQPNPLISQTIIADLLMFFGAVFIFLIALIIYHDLQRRKESNLAKLIFFSVMLMMESSLSYIFVAGRPGFFSILPSRYLYISSIGSSLFWSVMLYTLLVHLARNRHRLIMGSYALSIFIILMVHYFNLQKTIQDLVVIGKLRKSFLTTIQDKYKILPKHVLIYTESDKAFYGSPATEFTLPVQSGFGQMLLVWYDSTENFPACLFEKLYLYERLSQDYKECSGRGFGYFRDKKFLFEAIDKYKLLPESVIGFSYSNKTHTFEDITDRIRREIHL